ncbi:C-C motif chemokine 19-like [Pungitius pungitius]|uniref:C-C motif chemokine 19-like n=1 Tax=Pungitius pungitius TaxID=134920 RepID=UPI002E1185DA
MTSLGGAKLFFCILFVTYCCTVTFSQIPSDCCLEVGNNFINKQNVVDYFHQISGHGCAIDATILVNRQDRKFCFPSDQPWVHEVVKHVVALKKHCKRHGYKPPPCKKVKQK